MCSLTLQRERRFISVARSLNHDHDHGSLAFFPSRALFPLLLPLSSCPSTYHNLLNNPYQKKTMTVDVKKALGFQSKPQKVVFNSRDLMLYALSIGVRSPETELHFLYENDPNFAAFPTYPLCLGFKRDNVGVSVFDAGSSGDFVPGIPAYDPNMVVHGDQFLEIYRPLPTEGSDSLELHSTVTGVYDKGKGMVLEHTTLLVDPKETQNPYSKMIMSTFIRGAGGWGGDKGPKPELNEPPKDKSPDAVVEAQTSEDQAILFRLSG